VDTTTGQLVVIKILNENVGEEIMREIDALQKLTHITGVIKILGASNGDYYKQEAGY
jgi:hypothetical protein